jgi:hypothetical protein
MGVKEPCALQVLFQKFTLSLNDIDVKEKTKGRRIDLRRSD